MKKALVIGGGIAGCAAAHQLELLGGWDVTIVEAAAYLGAGVRTHWYGGHPYTFGPRHFLTQNQEVYNYMNAILPLRSCSEHEFKTYVERDDAFYNYPIHEDDIAIMPDLEKIKKERIQLSGVENSRNLEEYWINSVGATLYEKYIKEYNKKMWLVDDNKKIDTFNWSPKGVSVKSGPRAAWDVALSAYPYAKDGYNYYFEYASKSAKVFLNTKIEHFDLNNMRVKISEEYYIYDIIINTISPDIVMNNVFGELEYIGRDLLKIVFPSEYVLPKDVYFLYYANDEPFTRIVEYKKFTHHKSATTLIGLEIPSKNGKHYPLPFQSEIKRASNYFDAMPKNVFSLGRAGSYRYGLDIDDCIEQAIDMGRQLKEGKDNHPVPLEKWQK